MGENAAPNCRSAKLPIYFSENLLVSNSPNQTVTVNPDSEEDYYQDWISREKKIRNRLG